MFGFIHNTGRRRQAGRRTIAPTIAIVGSLCATLLMTTQAHAGIPDPGAQAVLRAPEVTSIASNPAGPGYWVQPQFGSGTVSGGGAPLYGVIQTYGGWITPTPDGKGYWVTNEEGKIFAAGDAYAGWGTISAQSGYRTENNDGGFTNPISSVAATPDGKGLWALDSRGHVWTTGTAHSYGAPADGKGIGSAVAVQIVPTPTGKGYTVLPDTGGVETFGDAQFHGSSGGNKPKGGVYVGMAMTADDKGYWLLDSLGHVTALGDAQSYGQPPAQKTKYTNIAAMPDNAGYWIVDESANVTAFTASQSTPSGVTFTNPNRATITAGRPTTITITAPGADYITASGQLPRGLTIRNRGHGKAVITGTTQRAAIGQHLITLTATDTTGHVVASQQLHLTVTCTRS